MRGMKSREPRTITRGRGGQKLYFVAAKDIDMFLYLPCLTMSNTIIRHATDVTVPKVCFAIDQLVPKLPFTVNCQGNQHDPYSL